MSVCRPPQVPTRTMRLTPSWTSSSMTIAALGQPMPEDCTEIGRALERAGEPEHPALAVDLARAVEEGLGDVARAQRIAGKEDGLGIVAGLAAEMDWHDPRLYPHGVSSGTAPCVPGARCLIMAEMRLRAFRRSCSPRCCCWPFPRVAAADAASRSRSRETITPIQPASAQPSTPPPSPPPAGEPAAARKPAVDRSASPPPPPRHAAVETRRRRVRQHRHARPGHARGRRRRSSCSRPAVDATSRASPCRRPRRLRPRRSRSWPPASG